MGDQPGYYQGQYQGGLDLREHMVRSEENLSVTNTERNTNMTGLSGRYQLDVAGVLTEFWDERLDGWQLERLAHEQTRITGYVRDQSELYGVIAAFRNLGLALLRVEILDQSMTSKGEDT